MVTALVGALRTRRVRHEAQQTLAVLILNCLGKTREKQNTVHYDYVRHKTVEWVYLRHKTVYWVYFRYKTYNDGGAIIWKAHIDMRDRRRDTDLRLSSQAQNDSRRRRR